MSDPKKPKLLTRLRIDEVSMVDRGAGANCKVVISKRDDGPDYHDLLTGRTTCAELYGFDKRASADGDEHAPAEWLAIAKSNPPEDSTMPINLSDIVKSHGVVALAKYMVEQNSSFGATETELVQLATQDAERRYPGNTPACAFAKLYEESPELRGAIEVAKSAAFADAMSAAVEKDAHDAMEELTRIGKAKWPSLTPSQRFARALRPHRSWLAGLTDALAPRRASRIRLQRRCRSPMSRCQPSRFS